jgi:PAS domain-containing protein
MTEDLPDERHNLEELYESAPCGYLFTRPDGTIVRVNQTFLTWIGEQRDALLAGRRFQDLLTVPSKIFYENQFAPLLRMQGFVREVAFDFRRAGERDREPLPTLVSAIQRTDADVGECDSADRCGGAAGPDREHDLRCDRSPSVRAGVVARSPER